MNPNPSSDNDLCHAPDDLTDRELAIRVQQGDCQLFNLLVSRYQDRLYSFLLRRTGKAEDAEDIAQEAFIRAYHKIQRYNPKYQFSTWLYTIAIRLAISQKRRRSPMISLKYDQHLAQDKENDPHRQVDHAEQVAIIWQTARQLLNDDQFTAIYLHYAEQMSISELAKAMSKSKVNIRVLLFRARHRLAQAMHADQPEHIEPTADDNIPTGPVNLQRMRGLISC